MPPQPLVAFLVIASVVLLIRWIRGEAAEQELPIDLDLAP